MRNSRANFAVGFTLAFVIIAGVWPRGEWFGLAIFAALLAGAGCGLGVRWKKLARDVARMEIFVLGVALLSVFQPRGLWVALELLLKAHICVCAMAMLGQFVSFAHFLNVLRGWGLPEIFLMPIALMERYRSVLGKEWQRLSGARKSRTFVSRRWNWGLLADGLGALLARSLARAERIAGAMRARGWEG